MLPFSLFQFLCHLGSFFCAFWEASGGILTTLLILWGVFWRSRALLGGPLARLGCLWDLSGAWPIRAAENKKNTVAGNARSALR